MAASRSQLRSARFWHRFLELESGHHIIKATKSWVTERNTQQRGSDDRTWSTKGARKQSSLRLISRVNPSSLPPLPNVWGSWCLTFPSRRLRCPLRSCVNPGLTGAPFPPLQPPIITSQEDQYRWRQRPLKRTRPHNGDDHNTQAYGTLLQK
jgi:hypothetical protein